MSRYPESDVYSQASDWLVGTARRNPEGLLLLAAGFALMMRSRGSSSSRANVAPSRAGAHRLDNGAGAYQEAATMSDRFSKTAEGVRDYARDIKDRASDTVGGYADSVTEFGQNTGRKISERSGQLGRQVQSTTQDTFNRVLREQPLAVAMVGLAAGAAVAAAFPVSELEERTLGGAREALTDAAGKVGQTVMDAAGKAGEHLKSAAEERGLTSDGLKDLAGQVAGTFTDAVSGKSDHSSPPVAPTLPQAGSFSHDRPGQSAGKPAGSGAANSDPLGRGGR
jgi:hypothetical protein